MCIKIKSIVVVIAFSILFHFSSSVLEAKGYGRVIGKFTFKGRIPQQKILVKKGDSTITDANVCAVDDIRSEDLVIDAKTRGIKNIFVYIKKIKNTLIHPDLRKSKPKRTEDLPRGLPLSTACLVCEN